MLKELKCKSDQHSKDRWSPQKQEAHKARDRKRKQQGKKSNEKSSPTPNDSKTPIILRDESISYWRSNESL